MCSRGALSSCPTGQRAIFCGFGSTMIHLPRNVLSSCEYLIGIQNHSQTLFRSLVRSLSAVVFSSVRPTGDITDGYTGNSSSRKVLNLNLALKPNCFNARMQTQNKLLIPIRWFVSMNSSGSRLHQVFFFFPVIKTHMARMNKGKESKCTQKPSRVQST